MLGITNLHDGMILSTLSVSSHGFVFGFPKRSRTNRDVFLPYKSMINPLISRYETPFPTILLSNKVQDRIQPSNNLPLIEA